MWVDLGLSWLRLSPISWEILAVYGIGDVKTQGSSFRRIAIGANRRPSHAPWGEMRASSKVILLESWVGRFENPPEELRA
jgi:hypothetical protein